MRMILLAAAWLLTAVPALAQSAPQFTTNGRPARTGDPISLGQVLGAFSSKADTAALAGKMNADGAVVARGATAARRAADRAADRRGPADYLQPGQTEAGLISGAFDAAPAINAALATGFAVLPCGTYQLNTPLSLPNIPTGLQGAYPGCVTVNVAFPAGDAVLVTAARSEIDDIKFVGTVARTSGAIIHMQNSYAVTLRNLAFEGTRFRDVLVDGANTTKILDSDFRPGAADACITLTGAAMQAIDTFISRTNLAECNFGIYINHASGVYLNDMDIVASNSAAVMIGPVAAQNQNVNAVRANDVLADTTRNGQGWQITADGNVSEIHLSNSWGAGSGQQADGSFRAPYAGLYAANPNLDGMIVTSFYAHHNGGQGIEIEAGHHIKLVSPMTCMNGALASNTYDGIVIGAAANFVTINDPTSGECGYMLGTAKLTNQQRWGLFINNTGTTPTSGQFVSLLGGQWMANLTGTWFANLNDPNLTVSGQATGCPALSGVGAPITPAPVCSTYTRTDGGPGTTLYVKEQGADGLGWVPK